MRSPMQKLYTQLLKYSSIKYINPSANKLLCAVKNSPNSIITRSVLARPKELDEIKKRVKERQTDNQYKNRSNDSEEEIGLYGYFLLAIPVITFGLGTWQVYRRNWKLNLIKDLEERLAREPMELPENLDDLAKYEYCPIKVRGEFLYDHEFVVGPRSLIVDGHGAREGKGNLISGHSHNRGYCVITPFKVENRDLIILVNRGWLPNKYKFAEERIKTQVKGETEIVGINRLNEIRPQFVPKNKPDEGAWHYRDVYQMAEHAQTDPIFLDLLNPNAEPGMPIGGQTRVNLRNEHLSYIITWYSLSALTGFYWYRIFIKKRPIF